MLLNRETWRLHRLWIVVFAVGLMGSIAALYNFRDGWFEFPGGSSTLGYSLGLLAGLIIVFEVLLWPRKKLMRRWRIGRARTWLCAHIWLGLLTIPLVIVHAGFPWGGSLATVTTVLLLVVVGSGIFGLVVQQFLPRQMTQLAPDETIYSQIENVTNQIIAEADALVSATCGTKVGQTNWSNLYSAEKSGAKGTSVYVGAARTIANIYGTAVVTELPKTPIPNTQILKSAYESTVRNYLESGKRGASRLKDQAEQEYFFRDLLDKVGPDASFVVKHLTNWCHERRQLDHQKMLHHWLHFWLAIHLPLSMALLVLVIWHAIVATKYSGIFSFI